MAITTKKYCTDWMIIKMIIKTTEKNFTWSISTKKRIRMDTAGERNVLKKWIYIRGTHCSPMQNMTLAK